MGAYKLGTVLMVCAFSQVFLTCSAKRGFILTSPRVLDAGSTEYFTIMLSDVSSRSDVRISLLNSLSGEEIVQTTVNVRNNYNTWVQMDIPDIHHSTAVLHIRGSFADGYKIDQRGEVEIRRKSVVIFIQTDKPIYKPGQTVNFRILPMDNQLIPLPGITFGSVWIEDPSGIRVAQWKKVNLTEGMAQLELPLSEEPVYGTWNIHASVMNTTHSQTFTVEEYVLPKFDIVIEPPPYVLVSDREISVRICARYTYGKNVDGMLRAKMTYKAHLHEAHVSFPSAEYEGKISGCVDFVVDSEELQIDNAEFGYRKISIFAEVTENGTGIVQNGTSDVAITLTPLQLKFLGVEKRSHYFKPFLSYHGKLKVMKPDGSTSNSESVKICATLKYKTRIPNLTACDSFISNKEGLIDFVVPAQNAEVYQIILEAKVHLPEKKSRYWRNGNIALQNPSATIVLDAWKSPSHSSLQIEPITNDVQCDRLEKVRIRYTTNQRSTIKFYHQVFSRGRIVQLGSHTRSFYDDDESTKSKDDSYLQKPVSHFAQLARRNFTDAPHVGEFAFTFDARSTMSPVARLLVFYVRHDGEVVADSRSFRISHCLRNQVKYLFRHSQQFPGTETAMLLSAAPSSLCGIQMVDKSIHVMHPEQKFSKEKVFKLMESFDVSKDSFSKRKFCSNGLPDYFLRRKRSLPAYPGFLFMDYHRSVDAITAFQDAGAIVMSDLFIESPCPVPPGLSGGFNGQFLKERISYDGASVVPYSSPIKPAVSVEIKEPEPEITSAEEFRSYFPETWLWQLHKIGNSGEIALKNELPHTITTWVGGAVCVHKKHGLGIVEAVEITAFQPFFASFNLPYSVVRGETVSVMVSVFNYLKECLPIKLTIEPSESYKVNDASINFHSLCVCGEKSKTSKFLITPSVIGLVNITVYAHTMQGSDICGNEITSRINARDAVTKQLRVEAEGFPKEKVFNSFFCPQTENGTYAWEVDLLLPETVVPESARAYMSITGDIMGPALNGLEELVRLPKGCGEQNMVLFTPNIFVLDYLTTRGYLTDSIKSKALEYMLKGYQRELRYRHKDGSYSAFGESDSEGSTWLTAFVVKSFAQARRFISIDEQDLLLSTHWIVHRQLENGCFAAEGKLLNKNLQGGLKGQGSLAPLTAYILIALLESNYKDKEMIESAIYCMEADINPNTYSLSLFAYAAALSESNVFAKQYLEDLKNKAVQEDNLMYWNSDSGNSIAVDVETAGYVILAMLQMEGKNAVSQALPIVRWMTKQRNANGGFVSTQDTVVALQALSKYSSLVSDEKVDLEVSAKSDNLMQSFKIDEANKLLTQAIKVPVVPTIVDIEANGSGCALLQFSLRYNVINSSGSDAFDLNIKSTRQGSYGCNVPTIGICIRYKIPYEVSNMAVLEVKMVSGYVPDEWSIYKLRENKQLGLKRHEIVENTVHFYFDQITNEQNCFYFFVKSEIEIENGKEARAILYDYYEPELQVAASYDIPSFCSLAPLPEIPPLNPLIFDEEQLEMMKNVSIGFEIEEMPKTDSPDVLPSDSVKPDDLIQMSVTTADPEHKWTTVNFTPQGDEMQADGSITEIPPESDPWSNFADVDEELAFPEGIEGNQPVYLMPPEDMNNFTSPTCPICATDFPPSFISTFCSFSFALRISLRNPEKGIIKILQDISPHHSKPLNVKSFGVIYHDISCNCSILTHRGGMFIFGYSSSSWTVSSDGIHQVNLTNSHVIADTEQIVQPLEIKRARKLCA